MLLERLEGAGKRNTGKAVIGYDLSDSYAQISYCLQKDGLVETLAVVTGTEQYNIPVALCRKKTVNQWLFGREAVKCAQAGDGFLIEGLVTLAREGAPVAVGEESFDPVALLTLFIRRSLSLLSPTVPLTGLDGFMFTVDNLDKRMIEILLQAGANLELKTDRIFFQSHVESYYHYMLQQPRELWEQAVLLCDYDNRRMKIYEFGVNRKTVPMVAMISIDEYGEMEREKTGKDGKTLDGIFLEIAREKCEDKAFSCVYLIGEGYRDGWASQSLRYLCRGRRAFQGNNLYSKGACYSVRERVGWEPAAEGYVFLGLDKLKANVGMHVLRRGEDSYFAIMDAGENWFEARKEFDVLLEDGDSLSVLLTPLDGKEPAEIRMIMEGLEGRSQWTTRLRIKAEMISEQELRIRVKDMGFGDLFPASGGEWNKVFEIAKGAGV